MNANLLNALLWLAVVWLAVTLAVVVAKLRATRRELTETRAQLGAERTQVAVLARTAEVHLRNVERLAGKVTAANGENVTLVETLTAAKAALGHAVSGDGWDAGVTS